LRGSARLTLVRVVLRVTPMSADFLCHPGDVVDWPVVKAALAGRACHAVFICRA